MVQIYYPDATRAGYQYEEEFVDSKDPDIPEIFPTSVCRDQIRGSGNEEYYPDHFIGGLKFSLMEIMTP